MLMQHRLMATPNVDIQRQLETLVHLKNTLNSVLYFDRTRVANNSANHSYKFVVLALWVSLF